MCNFFYIFQDVECPKALLKYIYIIVCIISFHLGLEHPQRELMAQTDGHTDTHKDFASYRMNRPRDGLSEKGTFRKLLECGSEHLTTYTDHLPLHL